jgi:CDP-diacylglycerol--glycerol-3-phosphate 3-phosphatidyltransferase
VIVAFLAGFLLVARPPGVLAWMPAILKVIADFTDFFDGIAARLSDHATILGETLDLNLDGLGMLVVTLLAFQYGNVPWWYLPVGFARYLFIFELWQRQRNKKSVFKLRPSVARRGLAALQMGFGTAALFPIFGPPATTIAATLFMLPFLTGFTYDWLQVSGRLRPVSQRQKQIWAWIWLFASRWLPLGLRAGIAAITVWRLFPLVVDFPGGVVRYSALGGLNAENWLLTMVGLETFFMLMMLLGAAGRPVAVFALLALGARLQFDLFTSDDLALLIFYTALLFLGTGRFSLWRPVDKLIHRRIGETD